MCRGEFLSYFLRSKWDCGGIEPSVVASAEASRRGIHVYGSTLKDSGLPEKYFDIITFLDMLYFDPTPLEDIQKARQALKDDGLLAIELPGLSYRIMRKFGPLSLVVNHRWNDFSSPSRHLFYFSESSLHRLLEKAGFQIIETVPEMAPLRGSVVLQFASRLYFLFSRFLFVVTLKKINVAAKVVYLCQKM